MFKANWIRFLRLIQAFSLNMFYNTVLLKLINFGSWGLGLGVKMATTANQT